MNKPTNKTPEPDIPHDLPDDPETSFRGPGDSGLAYPFLHECLEALLETTLPPLPADGVGEPDDPSTPPLTPASRSREELSGTRKMDDLPSGTEIIGGYRLKRVIGLGGCGEVWEAEQRSLQRVIAVKRLRPERLLRESGKGKESAEPLNSEALLSQFRQEALLAACLEHPNIMPVYDLVTDEQGRLMIAMKRVKGTPWSRLIRREFSALGTEDFLSRHLPILVQVAQALAFAHSRSIVHRDIKPSQVMVGDYGEVLVIDWGLAVSVDGDALPAPWKPEAQPHPCTVTDITQPSGTPAFMAPEQTSGKGNALGPWTDVYLLGATLYLLLTSRPPRFNLSSREAFRSAMKGEVVPLRAAAEGRSIPEELEQLVEEAMIPDYRKRTLTMRQFLIRLREFQSGYTKRRESAVLSAQIEGSLQHEQDRRSYGWFANLRTKLENANALWPENPQVPVLRDWLHREYARHALLNGDLVLARVVMQRLSGNEDRESLEQQVSQREAQIKRRERQRRVAFAAVVILSLFTSASALLAWRENQRANEELVWREQAVLEAQRSAQLAQSARQRAEREQYISGMGLTASAIREGHPGRALETLLTGVPPDLRRWEWGALLGKLASDDMTIAHGEVQRGSALFHSDFSPDGTRLFVGHAGGAVSTWDASTGDLLDRWSYPLRGAWTVDHHPTQNRLLITGTNGYALVVDSESGEELLRVSIRTGNRDVVMRAGAYSSDGTHFATTGQDRHLRIWDAESGEAIAAVEVSMPTYDVSWHPDGRYAVVGLMTPGQPKVIDTETGEIRLRLEGHGYATLGVSYSPDGSRIATANNDGYVRMFDSETGELIFEKRQHDTAQRKVAFSPDGQRFAASGGDGICRIWDSETGKPLGELLGAKQMEKLTFHPDRNIMVGTAFNEIKIWNLDRLLPRRVELSEAQELEQRDIQVEYMRVPSYPGNRHDIWLGYDNFWLQGPGRNAFKFDGMLVYVDSFYRAFSPDSRWRLEVGYEDRTAKVFEGTSSRLVTQLMTGNAFNASFSHDGTLAAVAEIHGGLRIWKTETWELIHERAPHPDSSDVLWSAYFTPGDEYVVLGWLKGGLGLYDYRNEELIWRNPDAHQLNKPIVTIDFTPDGSRLVTASSDETAKIWDTATGELIHTLRGHRLNVLTAVFSPDGTRVLTAALDDMVKLWDTETGREILTFYDVLGEDSLMAATFSDDGQSALFATRLGVVHRIAALPWDMAEYNCTDEEDFLSCLERWKRERRLNGAAHGIAQQ